MRLDKCAYMAPLGIEHFFDAFCFEAQRAWRAAACQALGIPSCHVAEDTHLEQMNETKFSLTPRCIPVERKTPAAKREVDQDMVAKGDSISDADSGWSGVSDNSSTDSECTDVEASSIASDLDRFDTAYDAFHGLADGLYHIDLRRYSRGITSEDAAGVLLEEGWEKLQELVHLPRTWPLARLTIPLEGLSKQIDRLLEGYCFQILATNRDPEAHNGKVLQMASHLTWILAEYLADTIAWLMRSILEHGTKILFDKDTQLLLTPKFWILPLYREFLNSARRIRPSFSTVATLAQAAPLAQTFSASFSSGLVAVDLIHLFVARCLLLGTVSLTINQSCNKDTWKALVLSCFFVWHLDSTYFCRKFLRLPEKWVLWLEFFTFAE